VKGQKGAFMKTAILIKIPSILFYFIFTSSLQAAPDKLHVVTTVSPIANLIKNVAGDRIHLQGLVPEGANSHTFEPSPSDIKYLTSADLFIYNGLDLEIPTERLAQANKKAGAVLVKLGDRTISKKEWQFDFSFPESEGHPNPHLWLNVAHAMKYVELIRDALVTADPANKADYEERAGRFNARLAALDQAIMKTMATIPEKNRKLITYHDSWAYFCPRYGCKIIGAIQPADFSSPSPREVARLIDQLKAAKVPAVFGSEVFPSKILNQIGKEAGVQFVSTLRDDDLPGEDGAPENSYIGMMLENVRTMAKVLGGNAEALEGVDPKNQ